MNVYLFSLLLGFVGLLVMAVSGVASHGGGAGHSHGGGHLHGGHDVGDVNVHGVGGHVSAGHAGSHGVAHAGGHGAAHGHAHHGHGDHGHHGDHGPGREIGSWFLNFLSPRALFSVMVGVGAAGLLLGGVLGGPLLLAAALAGGLVFEVAGVRPVWNFFFRFASEPALTLESAITDTATAVTHFNPDGEGLVKIELDGQIVQVLARLSPADRESGVRVRAGDSVVVDEVDAVRNRCVVSLPVSAGQVRGA